MSSMIKQVDITTVKTVRALYTAINTLLERRNFRGITIQDICDEATLCRAAFYSHFSDKYDLLKHWIGGFKPDLYEFLTCNVYDEFETGINTWIDKNKTIIGNIIVDADEETLDLVFDFILSSLNLSINKAGSKEASQKDVVLSNFYVGGIMKYLYWCINHKMPYDVMNPQVYEIVRKFQEWRL